MFLSLRLGTRGSALALVQSNWVARRLQALHPGLVVERVTIKTRGDRIREVALSRVGGKGLFVKEIETALLSGRVDVAVHSLKDLPTELPDGLCLAAVPAREDPRDALLLPHRAAGTMDDPPADGKVLSRLHPGAVVGTSSLRRQAQLLHLRPDLTVHDLRGNVDTRLRKLDAGGYDAIILSAAGLKRLEYEDRLTRLLNPPGWLPAAGQGALAVECRSGDARTRELVAVLDDPRTGVAVAAERSLLAALGGGCQVPLGALCEHRSGGLCLSAFVAAPSGTPFVHHTATAPGADESAAVTLGKRTAEALLAAGGETILGELHALQNAAGHPGDRK